jgi:hypothetical protein
MADGRGPRTETDGAGRQTVHMVLVMSGRQTWWVAFDREHTLSGATGAGAGRLRDVWRARFGQPGRFLKWDQPQTTDQAAAWIAGHRLGL